MDISAASLADLALYRPLPETAAELMLGTATAQPCETNAHVLSLFDADPALDAVTLVQDGAPRGLLVRHAFYNRFARPYARELYLSKSCATFADTGALTVEAAAPIAEAGAAVAERGESALAHGFVVVRDGRFLGHCRGITLMRALSDLQAEQHKQLLSSIDYAATIQQALLADSRAALQTAFGDGHALIWRPRDVVGGDCFFALHGRDGVLVGAIDCTGHGVPGALLTSIAISETSRLASDPALRSRPGHLISALNGRVKAALQQQSVDSDFLHSDDGMDAVFLWLPAGDAPASMASANLPVFVCDTGGAVHRLKGERMGVGYRSTAPDFTWNEQTIERRPGRRVFLATDGLCDQIGEAQAISYGWTRVQTSLQTAAHHDVAGQTGAVFDAFLDHQGRQARRDDVTLIGLDISPGAIGEAG